VERGGEGWEVKPGWKGREGVGRGVVIVSLRYVVNR
jgi:hypothetical protein